MPARLGRFQDILSCDKVSQHTFCPGTICRAKIRCSWVLMVGHFVPVMSLRVMTYCPRAKRRSGILLLAPPSQPSHTVSHVTLLVSSGKFMSGSAFFLSPPENKKAKFAFCTLKRKGGSTQKQPFLTVRFRGALLTKSVTLEFSQDTVWPVKS